MAFLGFHSFAEFNTYVTFVLLGMSIMMVVSAITSAPDFIINYYKYATGDPEAVAETPLFWDNANTFYNVGTYVMQLICEPMALTNFVRRIPLRLRLTVALLVPFAEMLVIIIVPAAKIPTQNGAIAVLMVVSVLGGFSKALCDSTMNALVGPFPTKFMNGSQWGLTVSALFMSLIQVILKASMGTTFEEVQTQSRIYFGIGMFIQVVSFVEFQIMPLNPYARKFTAEFRVKSKKGDAYLDADASAGEEEEDAQGDHDTPLALADATGEGRENSNIVEETVGTAVLGTAGKNDPPKRLSTTMVASGQVQDDAHTERSLVKEDPLEASAEAEAEDDRSGPRVVASVLQASGDADNMVDLDQTGNLTSADQMLKTSAKEVIRKVWPMLLCAFLVFFTSMLLWPGVFFKVPQANGWYITIVVLLFNAGDFCSRIILMIRRLRPSPKVVMVGTLCRLIIIPFLVLCVRGIIKGVPLPYVLVTLLGMSNGYFGTMAMIHCPRTPTLHTAGERSIAAIWSGIFLMLGLCFGSNLALAINLTI